MGLFDAIDVSGTGLTAERIRMDVTAENLANAAVDPAGPTASPTAARRSSSRRPAAASTALRAVAGWATGAPRPTA